jgi:hypothetical protein
MNDRYTPGMPEILKGLVSQGSDHLRKILTIVKYLADRASQKK